MRLNRLMAALVAAWCLVAPSPSRALDFPTGVVRIIVPYLPGGSAEAQARFLAAELQKQWGKPVIIENKPGAGTTLGAAYVATQKPDVHLPYRDAQSL
jgi:tripartite-type tricarboxylate transporter receptor subunit TctC